MMMTIKNNKLTRYLLAGIIGLAAVVTLFLYARATSVRREKPAQEPLSLEIGRKDERLQFSEAEKTEIETLLKEGKLRAFNKDSHEAWVEVDFWKAAGEAERNRITLLLASINMDYDGTRQISLKEAGSERTLAEYFSGSLRVEP